MSCKLPVHDDGIDSTPSWWMEISASQINLLRIARQVMAFALGAAALGLGPVGSVALAGASLQTPLPTVTDFQYLSASTTPPTEAHCFSVGRRCFTSASMQNSYNLRPLYDAGNRGQGMTIAIIDSFGNPNMASDLANFNTQMGQQHMCGEPGVTCTALLHLNQSR